MTTRTTGILQNAAASATLFCAFVLLPLSGCKKPIDDATLTTNVQAALAADAAIKQQPVQVAVQNGIVTLSGNVSDDTASSVAAQDAAKVEGVKEVANNLEVAGVQVAPTVVTPAAPTTPRQTTPAERQAIATKQPLPPPVPNTPPPPAPTYHDVSVPAGTAIPIRITQTLDSASTQTGTPFNGVVTREVVVDGFVVIPAGSAVSGSVVEAKDATHFKGSSLISIQLTALRRHGNLIPISTDAYTVAGKGRGGNTAAKIGGGAAIGAVLGGIFGGGKGAAIGAAAGGGGGAIVQGATKGQQVQIPSESVIRFRLENSFTVHTSEAPSNYEPTTDPTLQSR
jgi:BON domain